MYKDIKMTPEEESEYLEKDVEREKKIQRFLKKVLNFLKENKCLMINRHILGDYVRIEYG